MPQKNPAIDQYIAEAAPFARPILKHLRKLVHRACPAIDESIKWSNPAFDYKGMDRRDGGLQETLRFRLLEGVARLRRGENER